MFSKLIQLLKTMLQFANMNNKFESNSRNNGPNKTSNTVPLQNIVVAYRIFYAHISANKFLVCFVC